MKMNHVLKCVFLLVINWAAVMFVNCPDLKGQEIEQVFPGTFSLSEEGGVVRATVSVKNKPGNFVLNFAAGGLVNNYFVNVLSYRLVGNTIEVNVGPCTCLFKAGGELQFYTNAGIVRLTVEQRLSQVYRGFIKSTESNENIVFVPPGQSVTVTEDEYVIPPEAATYQYVWEVKRFNDQDWFSVNGATDPRTVTFAVDPEQVTMVRRVAMTNTGLLYSNVVYYIPVYPGIFRDIRLRAASSSIFPGKMISISPEITLGQLPHVTYQWEMKAQNGSTGDWSVIAGYAREDLQLPGIKQDVIIRRLATVSGYVVPSKTLYFSYVGMEQLNIKADRDRVSHFVPFTLSLEQEIGPEATFEWQKKETGTTTWTRIPGETYSRLINYSGIRADTYFRLVITLEGEVHNSNEVLIHYDPIGGGRITCSSPIIGSGGTIFIRSELPDGRNLGSHYSWEKKGSGGVWTVIDGKTEGECDIPGITENTYFRRKIVMDSRVYYSNEILAVVSSSPCTVRCVWLDSTSLSRASRIVTDVVYYDGAGRDIQHVMANGMPSGNGDIVIPVYQGAYNDKEREYLPYSKSGNNGTRVRDPFAAANWGYLETGERAYAFSKVIYDGSSLVRRQKVMGAGKNWHENDKGITTTYGTVGENVVRLYRVEPDGSLRQDGYYAAGSLHKQTVADEDGKVVETYIDREERNVLSVSVDVTGRLETYSVYDKFGLLRYVLSPEASARAGVTEARTSKTIHDYAFYYEYDKWRRMVMKQLPGCDPVYMVYDKRDRLVMSQDGKQRAGNANKWSYSLYDGQNRVIETGEVISTVTSHGGLQNAAAISDNYIPSGNRSPLQYTLYDTYTASVDIPVLPFQAVTGYASAYNHLVSGLVTSSKTKVLGSGTEKWLTTTTYYDDRGQVVQTVSDNLQGQRSLVCMKYDFTGNLVRQRESHQVTTDKIDVLESVNSYDDRGRLLSVITRLNNGSPATVACTYDVVGRLATKKYGDVIETLTYTPRGWLAGKESTPFKMKLRYEVPGGGSMACYNGNISEWEWQQGTSAALMYGFTYDGVDRLTSTLQKQKSGTSWVTYGNNFLENGITYDRNGNIKTLQRTAGGSVVDNLAYVYEGNQLTRLTENILASPGNDVYAPGGAATGSYTYDKNGNLIKDSRRVLDFTYNVLNLLSEVKTGSTVKARYRYLADGTKLQVRDGNDANGFDYTGSLIYRKSSTGLQLESANFGDGMIRVTGSNSVQSEVDYFLTDHLGSVRVIVDGSGVVKERNDYYPFGARHLRSDYPKLATNRYKYNGKEEQVTGDLEYLDYGARMYDSGLGRWFGVDPMTGLYYPLTPYCYTLNNPVNLFDPNGAWVVVPTRSQLFVMSEPGDDYNSLITFFGSEENALYYLSQNLLDLVKKGNASFYLLAFNATNNLSVAWTDVMKNSKKYGRRDEEEFMLSRDENFENNLSKFAYKRIYAKMAELSEKLNNAEYDNYNCHSASIAGSLRYPLNSLDAIFASDRTSIILQFYDNVTPDKAIFGRTIITFGEKHSALFLGKSRDGIVSVFTKNGSYFAPKIMNLDILEKYRTYNEVRNVGIEDLNSKLGSGYYNPKHLK